MDQERANHRYGAIWVLTLVVLSASHAALAEQYRLPLLPSASDPFREGIVRLVNHSAEAGEVAVTAIDDSGLVLGPVTLTVEAEQAIQFSSTDLEQGSASKGIALGVGAGQGDWRLILDTSLDIEPMAYVRTAAGFVDGIHDVVPPRWFYHRVALVRADSAGQHAGQLRLINSADTEARVFLFGVDDEGEYVPGLVSLALPPGTARTIKASELESGAPGFDGRLGDSDGDWQLLVFADPEIDVMALLDSVSGPLANLSAAQTEASDIPLFPSTADTLREGSLRITNRSVAGAVQIHAADDAGQRYGPVTLAVGSGATVQLSASDLQIGNAEKGLPIGLGSGEGDWRLRIESELDLEVLAYARTQDGFVTVVDEVAAQGDRRHHVPLFYPASETQLTSHLRLINPGDGPAEIVIRAWDDEGSAAPDGAVSLTLAAGASRSFSARALEEGGEGLSGHLGQGEGKWRLSVQADRAIRVMSLVESSEGHLTNLSTASTLPRFLASCVGGPADADGDGVSDHCDRDPATALRALSGCSDGTHIEDPDGNPGLVRECRVLLGFANVQTQGEELPDNHVLRQWGVGEQVSIDAWDGIVVSDGRVTEIRLAGTNEQLGGLTGSIPPELGQLVDLTVLEVAHNELTGRIPPALGGLEKLRRVSLNDNELTGVIPTELGNLVNLTHLRLDGNRLSGAIPSELGQLTNLTFLNLSRNRLSGRIPPTLGTLTELTTLYLFGNELTGPIPAELGKLVNLTELYLYDNALSGAIPAQLGQLTSLTRLHLYDNDLSGSMPAELGNLIALRNLLLQHNRLTGRIPAELGQLVNLANLYLYDNRLSGPIPSELGQLANMTWLALGSNALSGAIPAELGNLASLEGLHLYNNQLSGSIPEQIRNMGRLMSLNLGSNRLSGPIPAELGQLGSLADMYLADNELTGQIPAELGQLASLGNLDLGYNELTGPIPAELGRLNSLGSLRLGYNELTGPLPADLAHMASLENLIIPRNRLSGTIAWAFWERVTRGELYIDFWGNLIRGFAPPPQRSSRPVFSASPADNGNAAHHSVAYYQGPLVWSWNWQDDPQEHQRPILGRWAGLAVKIDHDVAEPPLVITRVHDSNNAVLAERLTEAAPPVTASTSPGRWRTEYVFELPGSLYQAGNRVVHVIDPDNELAETDESDNIGESIVLYGEESPAFRITFIPIHFPGGEIPTVDPAGLMPAIWAFWPIADDFEAQVGSPLETDPVDAYDLMDEMVALWNAEADPNEFYHGVYRGARPASENRKFIGGGLAHRPGYIGYSQIGVHDVIPHEVGHNLNLDHAPGCEAGPPIDENYPHANGGLGAHRGWELNWRRFVSTVDGYADIMSSCSHLDFPSDYHYPELPEPIRPNQLIFLESTDF